MTKFLVVFTAKNAERLIAEGGSAHWALNEAKAANCDYIICTRNSNPPRAGEAGTDSTVPHGAAFLIGKIDRLETTKIENGRQRFRVMFAEVAEQTVPGFWDGSRVPTRYLTDYEVKSRGLDVAELDFRPIEHVENEANLQSPNELPSAHHSTGLSIAEAKSGLAKRFGVAESDIDIVIRG